MESRSLIDGGWDSVRLSCGLVSSYGEGLSWAAPPCAASAASLSWLLADGALLTVGVSARVSSELQNFVLKSMPWRAQRLLSRRSIGFTGGMLVVIGLAFECSARQVRVSIDEIHSFTSLQSALEVGL